LNEFRPPLRSVAFCSSYVYSPRGTGFGSEASRQLCGRLKTGDVAWLPIYARIVREQASRYEALAGLFAGEVILVPVPGSAPQSRRVWAAERLAAALHGVGLGRCVWPAVRRHAAVRRSATAINADRPTVRQHFESVSVATRTNRPPGRVILVDDVITKGRTVLAVAARLYEAFPHADIRAYALVRTLGLIANVTGPLEPCQGVVTWAGGDAWREP
jgi:predicted amidophosphoribosyltransferase